MWWLSCVVLAIMIHIPSVMTIDFIDYTKNDDDSRDDVHELEICQHYLSMSDTNISDGYLSLYEYETFVNIRYYTNCTIKVILSESVPQWEAFTILACHSCLQEFVFVDTLPDCCLPFNNSRININDINDMSVDIATINKTQYNWLQRICTTADAAAVDDECYTASPTVSPIYNGGILDEPIGIDIIQCADGLIAVDGSTTNNNNDTSNNTIPTTRNPDGYINQNEFQMVLQRFAYNRSNTQQSCYMINDPNIINAAYANLACASCTFQGSSSSTSRSSSSGSDNETLTDGQLPDLTCCTSSNTSISIQDIGVIYTNNSDDNGTTIDTLISTTWLTRICTTISSIVICKAKSNETTPIPTMTPIAINNNNNTIAPIQPPIINTTAPSVPTSTNNNTKSNTTTNAPIVVTNIPVPVPPTITTTTPTEALNLPTSNGYRIYLNHISILSPYFVLQLIVMLL
jgi:hypothetical protein